jgi:hypothetical protein
LADIAHRHGPDNIGRAGAGCTAQGVEYSTFRKRVGLNGFMSVFTGKEQARQVLKQFKEKDVLMEKLGKDPELTPILVLMSAQMEV